MPKTKPHARFPKEKVLDGTMLKLKLLDWQIYTVIATHMNFQTHISSVSNRKIKELTYTNKGTEIKASVERLMERGLIKSWVEPYKRKDGSYSETKTKRKYHVRIGKEHT